MIRLSLRPIGPGHPPDQFAIELLFGDYAILSMVSEGDWQTTVFPLHQPPIDRGRYGSANEALWMLELELNAARSIG